MTEQTTQVKQTHTPGPWKIGAYKNSSAARDSLAVWPGDAIEGIKGTSICLISPLDNVTQKDEANAFLIAAAPELLQALRQALNCIRIHNLVNAEDSGGWGQGPDGWQGSIGDVLHQAILKAEGK